MCVDSDSQKTVEEETEEGFEFDYRHFIRRDLHSLTKKQLLHRCVSMEKQAYVYGYMRDLLYFATIDLFYDDPDWNGEDMQPGDKEKIIRKLAENSV